VPPTTGGPPERVAQAAPVIADRDSSTRRRGQPSPAGPPPWWTDADQAELDCLLWELVDGVEAHRPQCASCAAGFPPCPHVQRAIAVVLEWRHRRGLLSRARWLRIERELGELAAERALLERRAS
jgi:hypothetical protein